MNINNINVNKYPISQIPDPESKTIYEIPKYQREYIWGTKQWEELFNDLMENGAGISWVLLFVLILHRTP